MDLYISAWLDNEALSECFGSALFVFNTILASVYLGLIMIYMLQNL